MLGSQADLTGVRKTIHYPATIVFHIISAPAMLGLLLTTPSTLRTG